MKLIFFICFLGLVFSVKAQGSLKLKPQLANATPSVKAKLFSDLAWSLRDQNPDSSFYYARIALKYAKQAKDRKIEAYSLSDIGNYHKRKENYSDALSYYRKSLTIRRQLRDTEDLASSYNQIGLLYKQQEKYDSAAWYFKTGLNQLPNTGYENLKLKFLDGLGLTVYHLGQSQQALRYLDRSLAIAEGIGDSLAIAKSYQNKGIIHGYLDYYSLALEYYAKAGRIYSRLKNINGEIDIQINKASVYLQQNRTSIARKLLLDAEKKSLENGFSDNLSTIYLDLARIEMQREDPTTYAYFKKAYDYSTSLDKIDVRIESIMGISEYFLARGDTKEAEQWIAKLRQLTQIKPSYAQFYFELLSDFYKLRGDYQQAFTFSQRSIAIKDSLSQQTQNAQQLLIKLELSRKEKQALSEKLRRKEAEATFQNVLTIILSVVVGILLLLIYYIKKSHRINQEKRLQEQRFESEMKDVIYESEIRFMEHNLALEEDIRTRIGRDLHDHLGNKLAAAQVTLENIETRLTEDPVYCSEKLPNAIGLIDQACNDVRSIAHDLVAEELTNNSLNNALKALCDTVLVPETGIEVQFNVLGDPVPLSMIIKKNVLATIGILVDNTIRHAQASQLSLQLFYFDDSLNITLDDNGIGIRDMGNHDGIGLKNARNRIEGLGGIIEIDSRENYGTSISISIPIDHG